MHVFFDTGRDIDDEIGEDERIDSSFEKEVDGAGSWRVELLDWAVDDLQPKVAISLCFFGDAVAKMIIKIVDFPGNAQANANRGAGEGKSSRKQVTELATNGRNVTQLAALGLGVSNSLPSFNGINALSSSSSISFEGTRPGHNVYIIDGGEIYDRGCGGCFTILPSLDALAEFRTLDSNYSPDYGVASGGTITMVVTSVIGLDGTYGFEGLSSALTNSYAYDPGKMRAAFLDLRRARGAQGNEPLDLSAVESFRHANRTFITIDKMHHSDFTSFAMIGAYFHSPLPTGYPLNGWNRETGRAGYQAVCRIVLSTLDADLKSDSTAMTTTEREMQRRSGITIRHESAVPPPPSPLEAAALAASKGLDAAKAAFTVSCGQDALASCMNVDRFNTWGYNLLGQQRSKDALAVFQLNAWAHPQNANAQDSLADAFGAVGDKESAKRSIERAIALARADPSFDSAARSAFLSEENAKLQQFK